MSTESSPVVPYWHVWTDADGISHQKRFRWSQWARVFARRNALYIAETGNQTEQAPRQYIRVFNVEPDGATLSGGDIFYKIDSAYCAMVCGLTSMTRSGAAQPMESSASVQMASYSGAYSCHTESRT